METRRTGQAYLDGWVLDYNFFKDHEAHKGRGRETPAEAAGVAAQVPWDSWEDITRLGGEVAEVKIKSHTATPKKPGPKARPKLVNIQEAVKAYAEAQEAKKAHAKRKGTGAVRGRGPMLTDGKRWRNKSKRGGRGGNDMAAAKKQ